MSWVWWILLLLSEACPSYGSTAFALVGEWQQCVLLVPTERQSPKSRDRLRRLHKWRHGDLDQQLHKDCFWTWQCNAQRASTQKATGPIKTSRITTCAFQWCPETGICNATKTIKKKRKSNKVSARFLHCKVTLSPLRLLSQVTMDWVAYSTDFYFSQFPRLGSPRSIFWQI